MKGDFPSRREPKLDAQLMSDLWIFRAVARFGSITAAAAQLHVTQGAVSQRVLRLEGRMGVTLFTREHTGVRLTPSGALLAAAMGEVASTLQSALTQIQRLERRALVVSCSPSVATEWLMPSLRDFYREYPQIELQVRAEMTTPSLAWMDSEGVDVLIDYGHARADGVHELTRVQEYTVPVCSPGLRQVMDAQPDGAVDVELLHDSAAWPEPHGAIANEWQEWLTERGSVPGVRVSAERQFNLASLAYQTATFGAGLVLGRLVSVQRSLESGELVAATKAAPLASASHRVLAREAAGTDARADCFVAWLVHSMQQTQARAARQLGTRLPDDDAGADASPLVQNRPV